MGRSPCLDKKIGLKKGPWTPEEDQKLIDYINKHGYGNWRTLPKNAGLERCGKSCRLRWTNYLRPDIKRGRFSFEEEEIIIQLHSIMGNKWSAIAARLPGRTDNEIKNYWNTHIRKRLLKLGIDPNQNNPTNTHEVNQPEVNQYQTAYNIIGNQELQSCFPSMDQFAEFQDPMPTTTFPDSVHSLPLNQDYDYSTSNFALEPFYSDFASVLATPSSSPTPLDSSSTTYINSSTCSTEDEKESYCNNNFMNSSEIGPDYSFDVNGFLQF
ncbi:hypothetical protein YC2023_116452 [Brassica napus]